jgi:hypothetical protein
MIDIKFRNLLADHLHHTKRASTKRKNYRNSVTNNWITTDGPHDFFK